MTDSNYIPDEVWGPLREIYTPDGCAVWWRGRNKLLNNETPRDLWWRGEGSEVLRVIDMLASGAYS